MASGIITPSQMISDIGPDFFDGADADPQETTTESVDTTEVVDTDGPEEVASPDAVEEAPVEGEEEPVAEGTEEVPVEGQEAAPADQTQQAEKPVLPEGVRVAKDSKGNEFYRVEPTTWENLHASQQLFEQGSNLINAPLTMAALEDRQRAYQAIELMSDDFLSGDPARQQRFVNDWIQTAKDAQASGEIGGDPWIPFVGQLREALKQGSPDAYANLRMADTKDLMNDLYDMAAETGNQNLFHAASWIGKAFNLAYKPTAEMQQFFDQKKQGVTKESQLEKENRQLKEQLTGKQVSAAQTAWNEWISKETSSYPQTVVDKAIMPILTKEAEAWKKIQGGEAAFKDLVVDRLEKQVQDIIGKDETFQNYLGSLTQRAQRAVNPQARNQIGEQIRQAIVDKANLIVRAKRGEMLKFAAEAFKQKSDQTHTRRAAAQSQRAPKGASGPVPKSLVPGGQGGSKEGTPFNANQAAKEAAALIAAM